MFLKTVLYFCTSKATSFGPFYGSLSDRYTRTHERNYTIIYITLERERERERSPFTQMLYKTGKKMYIISENNKKQRLLQIYMNICTEVYIRTGI